MYGPYPTWATHGANARRRANDPDLEAYLRTEFRGGTTVAALIREAKATGPRPKPNGRDGVLVRTVKAVLLHLRRVKPVPVVPEA
ncbi:MAG: hypothetical protein HY557_04400 [Euryarchaeota archaeon]|nr:hypothetical protein [Euryarchaeota archaeon]